MKSFLPASLVLLATLAPAAAQSSALPYLPKDTIVAFAMPDLPATMAEFQQMPLAKMWAEEEVQAFLADAREMLAKKWDEGMREAKAAHARGELPVDPETLQSLRIQSGTLALTRLAIAQGPDGPIPDVGLLLHLEFGESAAAWHSLVQIGLERMAAEAGPEMTKSESKAGDVTITSFSPPEGRGPMSLNVALTPTGLVVGSLTNEVRDLIGAMRAKTPMLGAAAHYTAATQRLQSGGAEFEAFVRPSPMIDFLLNGLRVASDMGAINGVDMDGVERAVAAMGLRGLGSASMASTYADGKCITRAFMTHGEQAATAPTTAATKTVDMSFLKWVPKDAVSFSAGTMNVMSIYETLRRGLEAYDPEFAERMLAELAQVEQQLGFTIRDDFFGAFGDHFVTWSMPMGTIQSPPETAVLVKVTDEQKLVRVMKNLAKLTDGMVEIEEGDRRGVKAYVVRVNFDPTGGRGGINPFDMIQPTFSFKDGYMVAGFSAGDIKRVFQRMERKDEEPKNDIRGNKEFAAVASTIPAGVDSVSFTDWKANFESLYQVGTSVLAFVPQSDDVPLDMSLLPDSSTLTKHLFAAVAYSKTDATGTESVVISPFGPEIALPGIAAGIGVGVAVAGMRGF